MVSVGEAAQLVANNCKTSDTVVVNLIDAVGMYLSKPVFSEINMPPFRQSAMDGYALCVHESNNYEVIEEIKAGDGHLVELNPGQAVRIFTGAAVPDSANAVIMQERTEVDGIELTILGAITIGDNVRPVGEQVKENELALSEGTKITAAVVGFLTSLGIAQVEVYQRPKIGIIATGNELIEVGQPLSYGKIYESNTIMLQAALQAADYTQLTTFKVADNYEATRLILDKIIAENDVVLISGGISVGDYDYVGKALLELGTEQVFYKVKQRPGKPLFFGKKNRTKIFALPGNPAAALSCFYVYVLPALHKMTGNPNYETHLVNKKAINAFAKKGDRAQYLKAFVSDAGVEILEGQSSAMLQTFAVANALVFVPEELMEINQGDTVEVIYLPT
ncbi:MAG: molybdopterin molybdotransferase MoeA [Flavobacteriales bacterium]|nr:molybdopterin molybdotransferase MoeA [Flavobacteriales bacterium]